MQYGMGMGMNYEGASGYGGYGNTMTGYGNMGGMGYGGAGGMGYGGAGGMGYGGGMSYGGYGGGYGGMY